jgi:hypothetical protein
MVTILKSGEPTAQADQGPEWWTWEMVRDELVEVAVLWWRSPGGRGPAYATDGPWRQMTRDQAVGDYDARGGDGTSSDVAIRPLPLSCSEVDRRDRVSAWLGHVPVSDDRRLLVMAIGQLATGRSNVSWKRIRRAMGIAHGEFGLRKRYERSITAIAEALNAAEKRR